MFCSWTVTQYARYMNEIYQWQNGTAVRILQETGANRGTSVQPVAIFYVGEEKRISFMAMNIAMNTNHWWMVKW